MKCYLALHVDDFNKYRTSQLFCCAMDGCTCVIRSRHRFLVFLAYSCRKDCDTASEYLFTLGIPCYSTSSI